jgi:2-polyprenyl-3-methyl-5-hydroxy-6-metoxy-1,4-benzoquinol methylase
MTKYYKAHEIEYQRLRKKGFLVWGQKKGGVTAKSCRTEINSFLKDVLSQPWAPKSGRAIELGCGSGPILRSVCKKGFSGVGIDVSKTAIVMAKEQSKGLDIKYKQADVCDLNVQKLGKFDLVIDGLCLHCITQAKDRKAYLDNAYKLLKEGGLFVLLTMCEPVDKKLFAQICKGHKIAKKVIYIPFDNKSYGGLVKLNGRNYLPTRYIGHWKAILDEVRKAGFELKLIRYNSKNSKEFCGTLTAGALKL